MFVHNDHRRDVQINRFAKRLYHALLVCTAVVCTIVGLVEVVDPVFFRTLLWSGAVASGAHPIFFSCVLRCPQIVADFTIYSYSCINVKKLQLTHMLTVRGLKSCGTNLMDRNHLYSRQTLSRKFTQQSIV